jgi:hypothetical protein
MFSICNFNVSKSKQWKKKVVNLCLAMVFIINLDSGLNLSGVATLFFLFWLQMNLHTKHLK